MQENTIKFNYITLNILIFKIFNIKSMYTHIYYSKKYKY